MKKQIVLEKEFNIINFFDNNNEAKLNEYECSLKNINNKFILKTNKKIDTSANFRFENIDNMVLKLDNSIAINILSSQIKSSDGLTQSTFSINEFSSEAFNASEEKLYRLVIPYDGQINIRYYDFFSIINFMISINNNGFGGIEFNIEKYTMSMYDIDNSFIVECSNAIPFTLFDKYCRICLAAFGFVTGFVPMDKGYYFSYEDFGKTFQQFLFSSTFDNSYKSQYRFLTTNPHEFYQDCDINFEYSEDKGFQNDQKIDELKLKALEKDHFEKLIASMLSNNKFSEAIYSLLSINNLEKFSIFLKAGTYAIVLEMITAIISNENRTEHKGEIFLQQENSSLKTDLQQKLHNMARAFFQEQGFDYNDSTVEKRIKGIYTPINSKKLTMPYDLLGIKLTTQDIKNINMRNKLLHGSIPYDKEDLHTMSKKLFYITLELAYLASALIYKYIGFNGPLKNLAKIYLGHTGIDELKEQNYYKKLK